MLGELQPWFSGWPMLQDMNRFRQEMDRLFERFFGEDAFTAPGPMLPRAEYALEDGKWTMRMDLPGVDVKDIDISIAGDTLTVRASRERRADGGPEHSELSYGRYERSVRLPKGLKTDEFHASYRNGVLELSCPATAELTGRRIPVEIGAGEHKQIESKAA